MELEEFSAGAENYTWYIEESSLPEEKPDMSQSPCQVINSPATKRLLLSRNFTAPKTLCKSSRGRLRRIDIGDPSKPVTAAKDATDFGFVKT